MLNSFREKNNNAKVYFLFLFLSLHISLKRRRFGKIYFDERNRYNEIIICNIDLICAVYLFIIHYSGTYVEDSKDTYAHCDLRGAVLNKITPIFLSDVKNILILQRCR